MVVGRAGMLAIRVLAGGLIQVATIGLIKAIDRFEPARGSHFLSYAVPTITGEVRRYFRDHGWGTWVPRQLKDLYLAIRNARPNYPNS